MKRLIHLLGSLWGQLRVRLVAIFGAIALITYLLWGLLLSRLLGVALPEMERLYPPLALALIGSLVAIAGAGVYVGGNIARVLRNIERVALRIAKGELDQRVPVTSHDEIGRLAQTINDMADELARLTETRNQFLGKVSHELRGPLARIKVLALTIPLDENLSPTAMRYLSIIDDESDNLTRLVEDLLELSRLDVGHMVLECEQTDVVKLVADIIIASQKAAQEMQVSLILEASAEDIWVWLDPQRIRQVINNIINNALRHSAKDGCVRVIVELGEPGVWIVVEDTGPGIPEGNLELVFERFYQGAPNQEGMGLGLAVAKELVEAHGGTIGVRNRPEGGCSFTVWLPPGEPLADDGAFRGEGES